MLEKKVGWTYQIMLCLGPFTILGMCFKMTFVFCNELFHENDLHEILVMSINGVFRNITL